MGVLALAAADPATPSAVRAEPPSAAVVVRKPVNLLGEALATPSSRLVRGRSIGVVVGGPELPAGRPVACLPTDWAPKRACSITSTRSLEWCSAFSAAADGEAMRAACRGDATDLIRPGAAASSRGVAERDGVSVEAFCVRLRSALLTWRHPSQRLPPMVSKQLAGADVGPAEAAYSRGLRENWQAALRSLYHDVREGRLPYFYAQHDAFSLLWRNGALPANAAAAAERAAAGLPPAKAPSGAGAGADPTASEGGGAESIWRYLQRGGGSTSYAVLAPSSRGLRMQLRAAGVPFEMPHVNLVNTEVASLEPSPPGERYLAEVHELNLGRLGDSGGEAGEGAEVGGRRGEAFGVGRGAEVEREAMLERWLSTADGKPSSALLFRGAASLHALYDFLQVTAASSGWRCAHSSATGRSLAA